MKKYIIPVVILIMVSWQCSKDDQVLTLKESVEESALRINTALERIAGTTGYRLLSVTEEGVKSDDIYGFRDSIDLKTIAGIYDFKPGTENPRDFYFPYRLFTKTGNSKKLIVNLPEKLVFHPKYLHFCDRADSVLKNNFTISAIDYHFYYTRWNNYDYKLVADFYLNAENLGNLDMFSSWRSGTEGEYSKIFSFAEGYSVINAGEIGSNNKFVFALTEDRDTLLKETLVFLGEGFNRKEKQFILSIGNVDIKRGTGIDSIQVYLSGTLQKTAGAKIIDNNDFNSSICHKRDILLSFDDGTSSKLSDLIGPAMETLKSLSKDLSEMYFSKHIVDYIAFSIHYGKH